MNKLKECGGECVLFSGKRVSDHLTLVSSSLKLCGSQSNHTSIFSRKETQGGEARLKTGEEENLKFYSQGNQ